MSEYIVKLRSTKDHPNQRRFVDSRYKRVIVKAGRRGGKTVGAAIKAVKAFLAGRRVLYAAPTSEQTEKFWYEVKLALKETVQAGIYKQNDSEQFIERPGTENRIKAKTAWNANTLRGDYADELFLDEFQLMAEDAWNEVGAPMLLDNNGNATFIFTPPSLKASGVSKAKDPRHASKLYKSKLNDPVWECIHFTSFDNPHISNEALNNITADMSLDSYRREILAQDDEIELSWLVYGTFNETLCKIKAFDIPKNWDVYSGHDFGTANPAALFLTRAKLPLPAGAPFHMRAGDLVVFSEYLPGGGYSTAQHAERFKEIARGYHLDKSVGGSPQEDEIRQGYNAAGWHISPPTITKVNSQIDRVLGVMELNKLFIFDRLYRLLTEIANCMWQLDNENKPTKGRIQDEHKYHALAALRYIVSALPLERNFADTPMTVRYGPHGIKTDKPGIYTPAR